MGQVGGHCWDDVVGPKARLRPADHLRLHGLEDAAVGGRAARKRPEAPAASR